MDSAWTTIGLALHGMAGVAALAFAAWLLRQRKSDDKVAIPLASALFATTTWVVSFIAYGSTAPQTLTLLSLHYVAWLWPLYRFFARDDRHQSVKPIRTVLYVLVFVEAMQLILMLAAQSAGPEVMAAVVGRLSLLRLLFTVGALVLVHNLYVGGSSAARALLRWPAAALGTMWLYDLNLHTVALLSSEFPLILANLRGGILCLTIGLLALGTRQGAATVQFQPSRSVTFQSISLFVIGAYLVGMVLIAQGISYIGGEFWRLAQIAFVVFASTVALMLLPSRKLRSWLRVVLAKHLFQHRYDYRTEWLRLMKTISKGGEDAPSLRQRIIQSVADITESPGGLLLTPGEDGGLVLDARWGMEDVEVSAIAMPAVTTSFFEARSYIADLDDIRAGTDEQLGKGSMPDWMLDRTECWAIVPLIHYGTLLGMVVLARPQISHKLDWEDFDLLRTVGQQLASYLAEQEGQRKLGESQRFDEFNRRIAFVMHDIKNLASQLSLLSSNAEKHAEKPEFRADMLVTLRNSSDKLNALLARLGRYGASSAEERKPFDLVVLAKRVVQTYAVKAPQVVFIESEACEVTGQHEALEQAITHIVHNAIEASPNGTPVCVSVYSDTVSGTVEISDSGIGMSAEFVRNELFKPFSSSKQGGFGIGAYEARELVRAMGGRLDVESHEGLGTRFFIRLPRAAMARPYGGTTDDNQQAGKAEVA